MPKPQKIFENLTLKKTWEVMSKLNRRQKMNQTFSQGIHHYYGGESVTLFDLGVQNQTARTDLYSNNSNDETIPTAYVADNHT